MIACRLHDKQARGEPITIENFVKDTITVVTELGSQSDALMSQGAGFQTDMAWSDQPVVQLECIFDHLSRGNQPCWDIFPVRKFQGKSL